MSNVSPELWVTYRAETGDIVRAVMQVRPPRVDVVGAGLKVGVVPGKMIHEISQALHRVDLEATARLEYEMLAPQVKVIDRPPAELRAAALPPLLVVKNLIAAELAATDAWQMPLPKDRPVTCELTAARDAFKSYRAELRAITGDDPADLITRLPFRPGGADAFRRLRNLVNSLDATPEPQTRD